MSKIVRLEKAVNEQQYNQQWLKTFKGFEGYSDEQAEHELSSLKKLAEIVCKHIINTS